MESKKKDVYEIITSRIIEQLEQGRVPWKQPWKESGLPQNLISKRHYRGINLWLLLTLGYSKNYFLTLKQINDLGGKVKKGEKSCPVVFWTWIEPKPDSPPETKKKPLLRYYMVFNIEQCENIPEGIIPSVEQREVHNPIVQCEKIVEAMPKKPKITHKEAQAFYDPARDYINMPKPKSFESSESYYDTLFHELVHSTGHSSRLNRKEITGTAKLGDEAYSSEELVAEIGACYLCSHAGIEELGFENSVAYIQSWLKKLKDDKRCVIFAAAKAQKAVDFILNVSTNEHDEEPE